MIKDGLDQYEAQNGCLIANVYTHEDVCCLLKDFTRIGIQQTHVVPYIKIPIHIRFLSISNIFMSKTTIFTIS